MRTHPPLYKSFSWCFTNGSGLRYVNNDYLACIQAGKCRHVKKQDNIS